MTDLEKLATTLQYRVNHARNNRMKTVTIFISTLSECLDVIRNYEAMLAVSEPVPPETIPGLTIERCALCHKMMTNDMNYCPKCGRKVKR
jgi:hypothetical protein